MIFSAVSIGAVIFLYSVNGAPSDFIEELAKVLLQLGVLSVAAALLSAVVASHQRLRQERQQAREYCDELLNGTLARTMAGYNAVKQARRILRGRTGAHRNPGGIPLQCELYDRLLGDLIRAELELEAITADLETSRLAFDDPEGLKGQLDSMTEYLSGLIEEYEDERYKLNGSDETIEAMLPELSDLIGPYKSSRFRSGFAHPYEHLRAKIRGQLSHAKLAGIRQSKRHAFAQRSPRSVAGSPSEPFSLGHPA
ncbi:MAG TPA: hypothetical protein VN231_07345 [Allosphingosinicella sp.]|nr:hypothetical protein [Allosphingosinicella sp.]